MREKYSPLLRMVLLLFVGILIAVNLLFAYKAITRFELVPGEADLWKKEQAYAGPLAWLREHETDPVVVWANPHADLVTYITSLSPHYVLYQQFGQFNLLSNEEFYERYLVSQYFDNPTTEDLKSDIITYVGRSYSFHYPKTVERGIKICRLLNYIRPDQECGTPPSAAVLLGDQYFTDLENKFTEEIKPHIQDYLAKYHVSYVIKDIQLDTQYHPEKIGGVKVYDDGHFQIYKLSVRK